MQWSCSNLLISWFYSIFESLGTKSMFGLSYELCKPIEIVVGVGTLVLGMKYLSVANGHWCHVETTSSNCWASSWLPPLWLFIAWGWVDVCGVTWWVVKGMAKTLYTIGSTTTWCCSLACIHYVTSMFGAFIGSFLASCTYYSLCICADFNIGWYVTYSNYFLRLLMITFDISWNQQVLGNPLHYFWT